MTVYVNTVAGEPDFASLPAAKLLLYPLEARDYRPFAQAQFALSPERFYARLTAFEAKPDPHSALILALEGGVRVCIPAPPGELPQAPEDLPFTVRRTGGEDLQGVFWGVEWSVPRAALEARAGRPLRAGGALRGNVYKICRGGERDHCGSLLESRPVCSAQDVRESDLGEWSVAGY